MAQYGQALGCRLWAGCACTPREHTHRPEPGVAVGSRGEPQLPAISPQPPCSPALPCSSRAAPPATRGGTPRHRRESGPAHTHTQYLLFGRLRHRSCSACVKPAKRFERSSSFVAAASPSALSETWGEGTGVVRGCRCLVVWWSGGLVVWRLTSRSSVWCLVPGIGFWFLGHPPHLGGASVHSLSGNAGPKHSRGGAIGQSPTRGRTLADLPRWAPGRLPQMHEEIWPI